MKLSQRALIRHAVVQVLKSSTDIAAICGQRVHPNRSDHWLEEDLPAIGVYILKESPIAEDVSPKKDERRIALQVEILVRENAALDDTLDILSLFVEQALFLPDIGTAMEGLQGQDTLLLLAYTGTEEGLASLGAQDMGVAVLSFDIEYANPQFLAPLPDFLLAASGWNLAATDAALEAHDFLTMPQT